MLASRKYVTRWMFLSLCSLFLLIFLSACGGSGGSSSASTPTATPPTPTTAPTSASTTQSQTYTGSNFTIQYPAGWKTQTNQSGVTFSDPQQLNYLVVGFTANPGGTITADKAADTSLTLIEASSSISNAQPVSLPATTMVGGDTWVQRGITGTVKANGAEVPGELVLLVDNHPAVSPTTQTFQIYYAGPSATFQVEDQQVFQAMLQTFKFTA